MTRIGLVIAAAALAFAAVVTTSQAAPVAPLPSGITAHSEVTQVWWRNRWGRRCWRGRWGRIHCW